MEFSALPLWHRIRAWRPAVPALTHTGLQIGTAAAALLLLLAFLPWMVQRAVRVDRESQSLVLTGDDNNYQALALNLIHGYGFSDGVLLPVEEYHLKDAPPDEFKHQYFTFYRSPGFPLVLGATYALFGNQTVNARLMLAACGWLTALLLVPVGLLWAGWIGALAAGITAYYYLNYSNAMGSGMEGFLFGRILSEPVTALWLALTVLLFSLYLKKGRPALLYGSAFTLMLLLITRVNLLLSFPLMLLYLFFVHKERLSRLLVFSAILLLPILAWSVYASLTLGQLVLFTTQGAMDFPRFNNKDVLTGFGPDHLYQGGWQPGYAYNENGDIIITNEHAPQNGENGWVKGLNFWIRNPEKLPRLFYVKMRAGLWYNDGRVYQAGIGFLLLALGLRRRGKRRLFPSLAPPATLALQAGLVTLLVILNNSQSFLQILLIWAAITVVALLQPYGESLALPVSPAWALAFIGAILFFTLVFGGFARFHATLDPVLMLAGLSGLGILVLELLKWSPALAFLWLCLCGPALVNIFYFLQGKPL